MPTVVVKDPIVAAVSETATGPCACCVVCCPQTPDWIVYIEGFTDDAIDTTGCDSANGTTLTLPWDNDGIGGPPPRVWLTTTGNGYVDCPGFGQAGAIIAELACGETYYQLGFSTDDTAALTSYTLLKSDWDCEACNVMSLVADESPCCDFPATITVCPDGVTPPPMAALTRSTPQPAKQKPAPCEHEGEILYGEQRNTIGRGQSNKAFRFCLYDGEKPSKAVEKNGVRGACRCEGCGPKCDKYKPGGNDEGENGV